ncbi:isochorismate synthase [Erwinia sp. ErVv1]|uniref:isochorismate synthase n=1 Tax=Erwinia sp. ErVv1 TaxID=1603299 RepID=UPI00083277CA|nr:isochorismate synthase [Erwinia sp. ErVv1]
MLIFAAIQHLRQQLLKITDSRPGYARLDTLLPAESDGLRWLAAQAVWPQFYWQPRDTGETLTACGELMHAESAADARQLLETLPPGWKLVGANEFGLTRSFLFLPRLLLQGTTLSIFLHDAVSLQADLQRAIAFLDSLLPARDVGDLPDPLSGLTHLPQCHDWTGLVERALASIQRGDLDKVVLARATDLSFTRAVSAASLLGASRDINQHCYHFLLALEPGRAFIGSSPERLYHRRELRLLTEALAGTCANSADGAQADRLAHELLQDDKNLRENGMVVEDICLRLRSVTADLDVLPVETLRLRHVQHLRRRIRASLARADDLLCLSRLQPTAAVAGLPRQPARSFIAANEPFPRGWYAGSVGYLSAEVSEFAVALRSAGVEGNLVRLYAGAGIVAGSEAQSEWQELNHKAAGLASLLNVDLTAGSCLKSK